MVTEHNAPTRTKDEAVLVDIDLSILGTRPDVFQTFESSVRKEYRFVPRLIYRRKRTEILRGFLERAQIYSSGCFSEWRERQARENLLNAIAKLEGSG